MHHVLMRTAALLGIPLAVRRRLEVRLGRLLPQQLALASGFPVDVG